MMMVMMMVMSGDDDGDRTAQGARSSSERQTDEL
jgi:hypothetical protein